MSSSASATNITGIRTAARRFSYVLARVVEFVMAVALVGVAVMIILQVLFRYVLGAPLHYTEEVARYLTIWAALLGAALGVRSGTHFSVAFLIGLLHTRLRRVVVAATGFLGAAFIVVFLITSLDLLQAVGVQSSPALRIPMPLVYAAAPASALLMLMFLAANLVGNGADPLPSEIEPAEQV